MKPAIERPARLQSPQQRRMMRPILQRKFCRRKERGWQGQFSVDGLAIGETAFGELSALRNNGRMGTNAKYTGIVLTTWTDDPHTGREDGRNELVNPDGGRTTYAYDAAGRGSSQVNALGQ